MSRLVLELVRPYRGWLAIVFAAMLVEIGTTLAAPWPLKLVIDDALGSHHLPQWLAWAHDYGFGRHTLGVALFAGAATLVIAILGAIATYIDNYYTTSVGQWVANDLRLRVYEHLHRLSLRYYDHAKIGTLVSTMTSDVATIQNFASSSTLDIVVDLLTIVFMVGLMFWLDWDFTLIAVAFTPVLLVFIFRFKKAVKEAARAVRVRQSEVLSIVQRGLGSIQLTKAFGRQDLELAHLEAASHATVDAALRARKVKSLISPVVAIVVAICTAIVLWKGTSLIIAGTMTAGALTVYLAYLKQFFKPVKDLASMTSTVAQTAVALERIQTILSADDIIEEHANAVDPGRVRGAIDFDRVSFGYDDTHVLHDVSFSIQPGQVVGIVGPTGQRASRPLVSLMPRFYDPTGSAASSSTASTSASYKLASLRSQIGFVHAGDGAVSRAPSARTSPTAEPGATEQDEIVAAAKTGQRGRVHQPHAARLRLAWWESAATRCRAVSASASAIARAVIRNSPIMILDEPTAALDTESERLGDRRP